jgi:release factor glutamine methyltransferase
MSATASATGATTIGAWLRAHADLDRVDRERLLCELPGITRARILAAPETPIGTDDRERLDAWSARRRAGEPIAYLLGHQGFRDFEVRVTPAVLIPRPETELLVEIALEHLAADQRVLELGTGSGAVAIAIARESGAAVTAVDVSVDALGLAKRNAAALGAELTLLRSDWFSAVTGRFHLIVSNPPYVAAGDPHLADLRHEPAVALIGGTDGFAALRHIIRHAPGYLEPGGWLILEHGFDQGPTVRALFTGHGYGAIETRQDLAGLDRVSFGQWT